MGEGGDWWLKKVATLEESKFNAIEYTGTRNGNLSTGTVHPKRRNQVNKVTLEIIVSIESESEISKDETDKLLDSTESYLRQQIKSMPNLRFRKISKGYK